MSAEIGFGARVDKAIGGEDFGRIGEEGRCHTQR